MLLSFVIIWGFEFSQNLILFSLVKIWAFEFCHNLCFWVLSQFVFLSFVITWVFEYCHNLNFWVLSQFEFLSFVTIWVFETDGPTTRLLKLHGAAKNYILYWGFMFKKKKENLRANTFFKEQFILVWRWRKKKLDKVGPIYNRPFTN